MIVLWRQPKDQERTAIIPLSLALVRVPKQSSDSELAALDPQPRGLVDSLERHETAVGRTDESFRIFRLLDRSSIGLELPVEELVERLCKGRSVAVGRWHRPENGRTERIDRLPYFADIQIVELDKASDIGCRLWRVVLPSLLDGHRLQELARWWRNFQSAYTREE